MRTERAPQKPGILLPARARLHRRHTVAAFRTLLQLPHTTSLSHQHVFAMAASDAAAAPTAPESNHRLQRAETVLAYRTDRIAVCLESALKDLNQQAVIRTAEAMGIHSMYIVRAPPQAGDRQSVISKKVTKGCSQWMNVKYFDDTPAAIAAMHSDGREIWATDLDAVADMLASPAEAAAQRRCLAVGTATAAGSSYEAAQAEYAASQAAGSAEAAYVPPPLPAKIAIVIGREADGVSPAMLEAATRRVFLPMYGFTESFNLSVATALVLQRLFDLYPECRGDMPVAQRIAARKVWYPKLLSAPKHEQLRADWDAVLDSGVHPAPMDDLRRESKIKHVPKKVRKRGYYLADAMVRGAVQGTEGVDSSGVPIATMTTDKPGVAAGEKRARPADDDDEGAADTSPAS